MKKILTHLSHGLALCGLVACHHPPGQRTVPSHTQTAQEATGASVVLISHPNGECKGGVMAGHSHIVTTAAHCVFGARQVQVRPAGSHPNSASLATATDTWFSHPGYRVYGDLQHRDATLWQRFYDIALLVLPQDGRREHGAAPLHFTLVPPLSQVSVVSWVTSQPMKGGLNPHPVSAQGPTLRVTGHTVLRTTVNSPGTTPLSLLQSLPNAQNALTASDSGAPVLSGTGSDVVQVGTVVTRWNSWGNGVDREGPSPMSHMVPLAPHRPWIEAKVAAATPGLLHPQEPSDSPLTLECAGVSKDHSFHRFVVHLSDTQKARVMWGSPVSNTTLAETEGQWRKRKNTVVIDFSGPWAGGNEFPRGAFEIEDLARSHWNPPSYSALWAQVPDTPLQCFLVNQVPPISAIESAP